MIAVDAILKDVDSLNKMYPKFNEVRIRRNFNNYILQKPSIRKKLKINEDLFQILEIANGVNSIEDIARQLEVSEEKVRKVLSDLTKDGVLDLEDKPSKSSLSIVKYEFKYPLDMVYIEPTEKCNFKCIHCYASAPNKKAPIGLNSKNIQSLVEQIDNIGVLEVCFTGGEPFISKHTLKISSLLKNKGIRLGYITNGSLLDLSKIAYLKELNPSFMRISFHSHEEEKFKKITGAKDYHRVLKNILKLKSTGIIPSISCTLFKDLNDSYKHIRDFLYFFKQRDFKAQDITFDEFVPDGCGRTLDYRIDEKEVVKRISMALKEVFDYLLPKTNRPFENSYCGIGVSKLCIKSTGDLTLCPVFSNPVLGNIFTGGLKSVWEQQDIFKYFRDKEYLKGIECEKCNSLESCLGGCRAKSQTLYGTMNAPDPWMCANLKDDTKNKI